MKRGPENTRENIRLAAIGEAPGYNEEKTGSLFSGAAGQLLDRELEKVGLKREWFFVTNAVKCRPEDNREPTPKEIRTCVSSYLIQELAAIKPQYGLVLGNAACQAIFGKKGITTLNATVVEKHGITWVPAFHPAAALRNPRYLGPFKAALLVLARLIRDEEGVPDTITTLVNTKPLLLDLIDQLDAAKKVAIDVETWSSHPPVGKFKGGGLAWWHWDWKLCTINFSFRPGYSWVLPLWHKESPWKDPQKVFDIVKPYIEAIPASIMHNGKYDTKCLWRAGMDESYFHTWDTMGAEYAIDENNTKDLGYMSKVYLGARDYKDMVDKGKIFYQPLDLVAEYGGKDSDHTFRLEKETRRKLRKDEYSDRLYRKLLHRADEVLAHVEYRGMPLDQAKLEDRTIECEKLATEAEVMVFEKTGWEFNLRSPAQVGRVLHTQLDFPVLERTKSGAPSTREGVLLQLKRWDENGIMDAILEYRKWAGYLSRYFYPYPKLVDERNRIHPHFKPYHTVTGRLSCEHPNLQQVPRDTFVRGLFGGVPGYSIIEADYSQAEMRLAAHYSQDRTLMRIFHTGRDVHMEMAMQLTGKAEKDVTSEERKLAKAVNFGFLYGMGWKKFVIYARDNYGVDVTEQEAQAARRDYFKAYRSLPAWHNRQKVKAERNGFVTSSIGRKRRLHDIHSSTESVRLEAERQAINSPVQSLASDMMLLAMIELEQSLPAKDIYSICTVHDSILFLCKESKVEKYAPIIKETMENLPLEQEFDCLLTVPIVADLKVGRYWSEDTEKLS